MRLSTLFLALPVLFAQPVAATESHSHAHSPYAGEQARPIKGLSAKQVHDLESGAGMALSLPAELNGYPGPAHVLEMAERLALTPAQRAAAESIRAEMAAAARALGGRIVAAEAALDRRFAHRHIDEPELRTLAGEIAALWGELRAVHLVAHLRMARELSAAQIARYDRLRGY